MSKQQDEVYASSRMALESALADYVKAAEATGMMGDAIVFEIGEVIFDATRGAIAISPLIAGNEVEE